MDLPLKFGTINKKNEFYKLTNKILFSIKKKYPDGINYSSCFIPASTIGIYCSDTNIALYDKGMKKIKYISSTIKTNDKKQWDIMFNRVYEACLNIGKTKCYNIIVSDLDGKCLDAAIEVMSKIKEGSRPKKLSSFL